MNFPTSSSLLCRNDRLAVLPVTARPILILPVSHWWLGYFSFPKKNASDKPIIPIPLGISLKDRLREGLRKEGRRGFKVPVKVNGIPRRWDLRSDVAQEAHIEDKFREFFLDKWGTNDALGIYPQGPLCKGPGRGPGHEFGRRTKAKTELPHNRRGDESAPGDARDVVRMGAIGSDHRHSHWKRLSIRPSSLGRLVGGTYHQPWPGCGMSLFPRAGLDVSVVHPEPVGFPTLCPSCAATNAWVRAKRLMSRSEVEQYLSLSCDQVQWLLSTGQIVAIRMRGEDRFDSRDIDLLVDEYKKTAHRRA
jgi:hypothetical protein